MNGNLRNHYLLSSVSGSSSNKSRQQQLFYYGDTNQQTITTSYSSNLKFHRMHLSGPSALLVKENQEKLFGVQQTDFVRGRKLCRKSNGGTNKDQEGNNIMMINNYDNKIRHFSKLSKSVNQQQNQQQQRYQANSMASGIEHDNCATSIGGDSAPEAAANAMVNMVRLILLILICVLLVKLRSPRGGSSKGRSNKRSKDSYDSQYIDQDNLTWMSDSSSQNNNEFNNNIETNHIHDSRQKITNFSNNNNNLSANQLKRKVSQPELVSISKLEEEKDNNRIQSQQQQERRRRHSDSCLAQLQLPPGPMGLPFLGYLPFVSREIHLTLTSLSERYGPIYQIFLGGIRVVVLNDASLVRQAFKQPVFSGRPDTQLTRILQGYGIVNSDGALWKEQRAFLHTALRKLGAKSLMSGSNGLEAKIQHQVKEFVNDLSVSADEGKPCQVRPIVARAVSSVVGSIVMNLTYRKYEEKEKFDRLIELMQEGFRLFIAAMPLDFIPIFRFLPGVSYAYKKMKRNRAETSAFFQGVADEHRKYLSETFNLKSSQSSAVKSPLHPRSQQTDSTGSTATGIISQQAQQQQQLKQHTQKLQQQDQYLMKENKKQLDQQQQHNNQLTGEGNFVVSSDLAQESPSETEGNESQQHVELENIVARDLVDAYIVQQKKHEKDGKENYFSDQQLVQIMSDIFSAGLETVTSTIEWSILFLILNTECQERIQEEIDRVIGRKRMPQLEDLAQMAYTEATIYEVLRRSNVVALGNAHATLDDASIGGFRIPKGTQVLPNLYGIHMNPKLWHEPEKFQPNRFIVNEKAQKPDYFIPFSVGRRMCLGDVLAKMEVFLFLVGLLQKYDLSVPEEDRHCPPQIKGTMGASISPASFRVSLSKRENKDGESQVLTKSISINSNVRSQRTKENR